MKSRKENNMDKPKKELLEMLYEYLEYRDGHLWWIKYKKGVRVGKRFGTVNSSGYVVGGFFGKLYYEHHLIWLWHYKTWPLELDHKDTKRGNNEISNLREATSQQNKFNVGPRKNSTSKYKGVCWYKRDSNWKAQYRLNGKNYHIGYYDTEEQAAIAYDETVKNLHQDFFRGNHYG